MAAQPLCDEDDDEDTDWDDYKDDDEDIDWDDYKDDEDNDVKNKNDAGFTLG